MKSSYSQYIEDLNGVLTSIPDDDYAKVSQYLEEAFHEGKTIFVAGNGGSAATASHMACDFAKTTLGKKHTDIKKRMRAIALSDNMPLITAWGNDVSYDDVFAEQLRNLALKGDLLIVITASGNSPNILKLLETARELGVKTVGLLGFEGGKSAAMVDHAVIAKSTNYGVIEDAHSIIMHMVTARMKEVVHNQAGLAV